MNYQLTQPTSPMAKFDVISAQEGATFTAAETKDYSI
jgi:hypothetical protein